MSRADRCLHEEDDVYFTYRPLSNLPTPPPTSNHSAHFLQENPADGQPLKAKYLGTYPISPR